MENGEKIMFGEKNVDENGYSEKKSDQNIELQAGQWLDLKKGAGKTTVQPQASTPQKALSPKPSSQHDRALSHAVTDIERHLHKEVEAYLRLIEEENEEADEVFQRITTHLSTLRALLKAVKWEKKGQLDTSKLPKEVQNLLK